MILMILVATKRFKMAALSFKMAGLGSKMAGLGSKMAALSFKMAALGSKMAATWIRITGRVCVCVFYRTTGTKNGAKGCQN